MQDLSTESNQPKTAKDVRTESLSTTTDTDAQSGENVVPQHVVIIMDGNHRWASARHLPSAAGHRAGAKRLRPIAEACAELGVRHLTVFAISTENWHRPEAEVGLLMDLMRHVMKTEIDYLHLQGVRLRIIGERQQFAPDIQQMMGHCEALTANNTRLDLSVAVNFGGRWDIVNAAKNLAKEVEEGVLAAPGVLRVLEEGELRFRQRRLCRAATRLGLQPQDVGVEGTHPTRERGGVGRERRLGREDGLAV